jgi:hypothetical protein
VFHAQERAKDVGVDRGRIRLGSLLRHPTWLALGTRVVDRRVQAAEALDRPFDQATDVLRATDVRQPELRLRAECAQFLGQLCALVRTAAGDDDL